MIRKILSGAIFIMAVHAQAGAQIRQQIEKHLQNPQRAEQEAKADRRLQEKNRIIADSISTAAQAPVKRKQGGRKKRSA